MNFRQQITRQAREFLEQIVEPPRSRCIHGLLIGAFCLTCAPLVAPDFELTTPPSALRTLITMPVTPYHGFDEQHDFVASGSSMPAPYWTLVGFVSRTT